MDLINLMNRKVKVGIRLALIDLAVYPSWWLVWLSRVYRCHNLASCRYRTIRAYNYLAI
jgi:hypothetical protein